MQAVAKFHDFGPHVSDQSGGPTTSSPLLAAASQPWQRARRHTPQTPAARRRPRCKSPSRRAGMAKAAPWPAVRSLRQATCSSGDRAAISAAPGGGSAGGIANRRPRRRDLEHAIRRRELRRRRAASLAMAASALHRVLEETLTVHTNSTYEHAYRPSASRRSGGSACCSTRSLPWRVPAASSCSATPRCRRTCGSTRSASCARR